MVAVKARRPAPNCRGGLVRDVRPVLVELCCLLLAARCVLRAASECIRVHQSASECIRVQETLVRMVSVRLCAMLARSRSRVFLCMCGVVMWLHAVSAESLEGYIDAHLPQPGCHAMPPCLCLPVSVSVCVSL